MSNIITLSCNGEVLLDVLLRSGINIESPCAGNGKCGKCRVKILKGIIPEPSQEELACISSGDLASGYRLSCSLRPEGAVTIEIPEPERSRNILSEGYMPEFIHDVVKSSYGLAVDIGTTTVAAGLIDFRSGNLLGSTAIINPQRNQGLDVLSRITYAQEHGQEGRNILQRSIVDAVSDMASELLAKHNIPDDSLTDIYISANTTMLHLFYGIDTYTLGIKPFTPAFTESLNVSAESLGMKRFINAEVTCLPSVSAYIGADITAGAYVCNMKGMSDTALFIDIGTNGEMILAHDGKLTACSCAAGPALEGMNISCGMRAADGAVEAVKIHDDGRISLEVIGNVEASGICGSGILSAVREFLRTSIISSRGRIIPNDFLVKIDGKSAVRLSEKIYITQSDIRQVQLAKGAILSGVKAMLNSEGLEASDLKRIIVAGQFGAHLPSESLTGCGLVPDIDGKIEYVGNTSMTGAITAMLSSRALNDMEKLSREINYIELSELEGYDRLFAGCMEFPERRE